MTREKNESFVLCAIHIRIHLKFTERNLKFIFIKWVTTPNKLKNLTNIEKKTTNKCPATNRHYQKNVIMQSEKKMWGPFQKHYAFGEIPFSLCHDVKSVQTYANGTDKMVKGNTLILNTMLRICHTRLKKITTKIVLCVVRIISGFFLVRLCKKKDKKKHWLFLIFYLLVEAKSP